MDETYDKLAARIQEKGLGAESEHYWVAIAGGPGLEEENTANAVAQRLNEKEGCCVVLPMDGFHYSQEELRQQDPDSNGAKLMERRGAPWTMNAELCFELLSQAKQTRSGELTSYSREISDPVPGGVCLKAHHRIVVLVDPLQRLVVYCFLSIMAIAIQPKSQTKPPSILIVFPSNVFDNLFPHNSPPFEPSLKVSEL